MSIGVKLAQPFDDVPRVMGSVYFAEFTPLYVQNLLSLVKRNLDLGYVVDIFRGQLKSWGGILASSGDYDWGECCCAVTPPIQYQSINCGRRMSSFTKNHKAIIDVVSRVFGVTYRECRGVGSMWSRVYDLRGPRVALLSFVPVFDFLLGAYELVMFMQLRALRHMTKGQKMVVRAAATEQFVAMLQTECLNFREGRL